MGAVRLEEAVARAAAGLPVALANLPAAAARALALAEELGVGRAEVLRAVERAEVQRDALRREVEVAAAEGRAVARGLVLAPPVVGPLTALLVTDDPVAVWSTAGGRVVLLLAAVLWVVGAVVVRGMVRRAARPEDVDGAEIAELVAVALAAGLGPAAAVRRVDGHAPASLGGLALWLELGARGRPPEPWADLGRVLADAARDGTAAVEVVRGLATRARAAAHHDARTRAARLPARLTLPTTLLLLPAAGLLVAAPLVHGLLTQLG